MLFLLIGAVLGAGAVLAAEKTGAVAAPSPNSWFIVWVDAPFSNTPIQWRFLGHDADGKKAADVSVQDWYYKKHETSAQPYFIAWIIATQGDALTFAADLDGMAKKQKEIAEANA